ncbi:hypothetical protein U5640_36430 [Streptomyces sp. SS7]|uniref:hypothetical protein n=1 Tax=Streptomyces sp. SS7 TaxID=3108485 RepID=UPI0030ECD5C1
MPYVVERRQSIQYDGTNGAHICGPWSDSGLTLISDDGETLVVAATEQLEYQATVHVGGWIIASPPGWVTSTAAERYAERWLELP